MKVIVKKSKAAGLVQAPPSKSMAHRLLIGAALAKGVSVINNVALSQDILATIDCLRVLGAVIAINGTTVTVTGTSPKPSKNAHLPCRESGSTLRFMIPLCLLSSNICTLTGAQRLMERPQSVYEVLCKEKGYTFEKSEAGITLCGPLQGGNFTLAGNISSQFITGLLYALPLTGKDSTITLTGSIESRSYIDLTLQALKAFGAEANWQNERTLFVKAGEYRPTNLTVEGDYSNAAFLDALSLLGGNVTVTGLDRNSLQGDKIYQQDFVSLQSERPTLSLKNCPDLGPIYMAMGASLNGCILTDTARLKIKESDRGVAMAEELGKFGIKVMVEDNRITVHPSPLHSPAAPLQGHNDHRIVMSLATLCTLTGGEIQGAEAVTKSFPDYFERIKQLGIDWKEVK